jgi:signal transduction histidine kinase
MVGIMRDITDDMQAEQLRLDHLAAERASHAKSEFLARVSHELRTPLNAILGFGELMQADAVDRLSKTQAKRMHHMVQGGHYLLRLVEDILNLSSLETGRAQIELREVDIATVVEACVGLIETLGTTHGVRVQAQAANTVVMGQAPGAALGDLPSGRPGALMARGDPLRLRQVLVNLLSNAIKYNRRGGSVVVSWCSEGHEAVIRVADDGPGMSAEQVAQLFQPFNRLGAEYSRVAGTGLGLVIAQEIVQQMGGTIGVQSRVGEGSCFTLRLPLALSTQLAVGAATPG